MAAVEDRTNSNPLVQPLLTDLYQITMAYAYWKSGKVLDNAVFDLYFRRNPFHGEFTVFAGLEECVHFVRNFKFSDSGKYLNSCYSSSRFTSCFKITNKFTFSDHNCSTKIQFNSKLTVEPDTRGIFINKGKTTTLIIDNYRSTTV